MYEQVEKPKEKKSKVTANSVSQRHNRNAPISRFVDNRSEAIQMWRLQALAKNSPQNAKLRELRHLGATHSVTQKKSDGKEGFGFVDDRTESYDNQRVTQMKKNNHTAIKQKTGIKKNGSSALPENLKATKGYKMTDLSNKTEALTDNRKTIQRVPRQAQITWDITHVVREIDESLFGNGDYDEGEIGSQGELTAGEAIIIDDDDIFVSRRGPNQENPTVRHTDGENYPTVEWYRVLRLKNEDVSDESLFVRSGTFRRISDDIEADFQPIERRTGWGGVVEIASGVGVEVIEPTYHGSLLEHSYVQFILQQVNQIQKMLVGSTLIEAFSQGGLPELREIDSTQPEHEPYNGIHVLIGKPYKSVPQIETSDQTGIRVKNGTYSPKPFGGTAIPRINFFSTPDLEGSNTQIGDTNSFVTERGIEGHRDFPRDVQTFDTVLAHEFVHAYLSQSGIFQRIIEMSFSSDERTQIKNNKNINHGKHGIDLSETLEEILVVGIENRYRQETQQAPRETYKSVNLIGNPLEGRDWEFSLAPKELVDALHLGLGLSLENATYIITGELLGA